MQLPVASSTHLAVVLIKAIWPILPPRIEGNSSNKVWFQTGKMLRNSRPWWLASMCQQDQNLIFCRTLLQMYRYKGIFTWWERVKLMLSVKLAINRLLNLATKCQLLYWITLRISIHSRVWIPLTSPALCTPQNSKLPILSIPKPKHSVSNLPQKESKDYSNRESRHLVQNLGFNSAKTRVAMKKMSKLFRQVQLKISPGIN